jgi:hypothetical protein
LSRKWYAVTAVTAGLIGLDGAGGVASAAPYVPTVTVGGAVASPDGDVKGGRYDAG